MSIQVNQHDHHPDLSGSPRTDASGGRKSPERQCLVSRTKAPKAGLWRFVISPDGLLVADPDHRLPGRGLYTLPERSVLEQAIAKKQFQRGAKRPVTVPDDFIGQLLIQAEKRVLNRYGLMYRAGALAVGFDSCHAALKSDKAVLYLPACDAAADGLLKLTRIAGHRNTKIITGLSAADQGNAVGHAAAAHLCLTDRHQAAAFIPQINRVKALSPDTHSTPHTVLPAPSQEQAADGQTGRNGL